MVDKQVTPEGHPLPINVHEYQERAQAVLSPMAYGYFAGGAGDEVTLRANRQAFDQWRLLPRVLRGVKEIRLEASVLSQPISMPLLLGPIGLQRLGHVEGEIASARAARSAGTIFTLSTGASATIEDVAAIAGKWWFQLYVNRDPGITRELVQRAEAAGAGALVVTVDMPALGRREADLRSNFTLPDGVSPVNFPDTGSEFTSHVSLYHPALSWRDLDWLASLSSMPLVLKGILASEDARLAFEYGAQAIVVSNHGGRQLDGAVASLDALPAVVEAVERRGEVLMDGGIRRGTDVVKALALGARAVLAGRPFLWGLAVGGEAGVAHVLELLRAEIALAMTLCGCAGVEEISQSLLVGVGPVAGRPAAYASDGRTTI
jgi:4-hydroxymandelate oxidase